MNISIIYFSVYECGKKTSQTPWKTFKKFLHTVSCIAVIPGSPCIMQLVNKTLHIDHGKAKILKFYKNTEQCISGVKKSGDPEA